MCVCFPQCVHATVSDALFLLPGFLLLIYHLSFPLTSRASALFLFQDPSSSSRLPLYPPSAEGQRYER